MSCRGNTLSEPLRLDSDGLLMGTLALIMDSRPHRVLEDIVVYVKVGRVSGRGHVGDVGGLSGPDVVPVDPAEERVALEVGDPVQTESTFPGAKQALDQIFGILGHVGHMGGELETLLKKTTEEETLSGKWSKEYGERGIMRQKWRAGQRLDRPPRDEFRFRKEEVGRESGDKQTWKHQLRLLLSPLSQMGR